MLDEENIAPNNRVQGARHKVSGPLPRDVGFYDDWK